MDTTTNPGALHCSCGCVLTPGVGVQLCADADRLRQLLMDAQSRHDWAAWDAAINEAFGHGARYWRRSSGGAS